MSLLAALKTDDTIQNETDSVGGGGPLDSGLYHATVSMAYLDKSTGGALGLNLHLKTEGGREIRQTLWVTSGNKKGNKNFYEKDGEKKYLPGFIHANALCLLTVGKEIADLESEEKVVKVYSHDAKAEVPTKVPVLVDLLNQEIIVGLERQTVDKRQKGDDGNYHPTGETRDVNEIDKFFRARDKMTTAEIRAGAEEPAFIHEWEAKKAGVTRDRTSKNSGNASAPKAGGFGGASAGGGNQKPTKSLFS